MASSFSKTLSILIPAFNESKTIVACLNKVISVEIDLNKELIVIDDGSTDGTYDDVQKWWQSQPHDPALTLICHQKKNGGKGSAIREAIARSSGEYAIVQDADLEYDPEDYKACLEPIRRGETKVVYGSRLMKKNNGRSYHSFYYGGKLVSLATNLIYGSRLTDEPTCYKTFEGNLLRGLSFEGDRFEWEPEITGKLIRLGHTIHEVPISYFPRHFDEGKKIGVKDGLQAIWVLLKWRWASLTHLQHCKK